jgi:putative transposase
MQGFIYMAHIAFADMIAASFNSRIGSSPHQAWENGVNENPEVLNCLFKDKLELKLLLMGGLQFRKISNKGIVIEGKNYNSPELMNLKNAIENYQGKMEEVRVRFDLSDMRSVYVYDKYIKRWIEAFPTGFERLGIVDTEPVPYSELRLYSRLLNEAKQEIDERSIAQALRNIESLEKENQKRLKQERENRLHMLASGNEQGKIGYQGISSQNISNELLELPEGLETLVLQGETVNEEKDENKEIVKAEVPSSISYEIGREELDYFETE